MLGFSNQAVTKIRHQESLKAFPRVRALVDEADSTPAGDGVKCRRHLRDPFGSASGALVRRRFALWGQAPVAITKSCLLRARLIVKRLRVWISVQPPLEPGA